MKRNTRTPSIHPLARATAVVLIGCVLAPSLPAQELLAQNGFTLEGRNAETEMRSATADAVVSQGANAALEEVVSFVGDSHLPFLGSLQGGITYDHANGLLRYNLTSVGKLYGDGTGSHWLGQLGAHNEGDRATGNAGLIYRWIDVSQAWLVGANLFYDRDFDTDAARASFGVEAASLHWRLFGNHYYALEDRWHDALVDADEWEERVADGYDLGAAWSPAALPSLEFQLKASRWLGEAVDVFDNDSLYRDPLVWSAKLAYSPIPLLSLAVEQERVINGDVNHRVDLRMTYRFGQSLADQLQSSDSARHNDLAARMVAPVERQHRMVMEKREKQVPLVFVGPATVQLMLAADETLDHPLMVAGGAGGVVFSLEGRDAKRFRIVDGRLQLAPVVAPMVASFAAAPVKLQDETLQVTVVARDARNSEARQAFEVVVQKKAAPVAGQAPTADQLSMTGSLQVGGVVTAAYRFQDADNDREGATRVQWYRASDAAGTQRTMIAGANALAYTIVAADLGQYLVVEVLPVSATGAPAEGAAVSLVSTTAVADATGTPGKAPTMTAPTLAGTVAIGETLTGTPGTFNDEDNDAPGTHRYQWYRASDAAGTQRTPINGATGLQYTITVADVGAWIGFEVIPVSSVAPHDGQAVRTLTSTAVAAPVAGNAPTMDPPTVTGHVGVGRTLTASTSGFNDVDGDGQGTHVYQWYRASDAAGTGLTPIDGANSLTHVITDADVNSWLHFGVTPVSVNAPTHGIEVRAAADRAVPVPSAPIYNAVAIRYTSGGVNVGHMLTVQVAGQFHDNDGDSVVEERIQWYRATDAAGTNRTPIVGARGVDYTITSEDAGLYVVMGITPVSSGTPSTGIEYFAVTNAAVPGTPTGNAPTMDPPTVTGHVGVGRTLTASTSGFNDIDGDGQGTHVYQWYRASDAAGTGLTPIEGANGLTHVITDADVNSWLHFGVTPVSVNAPTHGSEVRAAASRAVPVPTGPTFLQGPTLGPNRTEGKAIVLNFNEYHDEDGDERSNVDYGIQVQWYRATDAAGANATPITNATDVVYIMTAADVGFHLIGEVRAVSATGNPSVGAPLRAITTEVIAASSTGTAPTMDPPTVTGHVGVGRTLTASTSGFNDIDGDGQGTHVYQWYRASDAAGTGLTPIDGANGLTHVITDADVNSWLHFGVTPVSDKAPTHGTEVRAAAARAVPTPTAPVLTQGPTLIYSGEVAVGQGIMILPISQAYHDEDGDPRDTIRVQWYRSSDAAGTNRTPIVDATDGTYMITSADAGSYLSVGLVPVAATGTPNVGIEYFAVAKARVPGNPPASGSAPTMDPPTVTGHVGVGRTLTATTSGFNDVDGDGQGTHVYQWYRASDAAGTALTPIEGANSLTHVITDADVNSWLHFGVTPVSDKAPTHGTEVRNVASRAVPVPTAPTLVAPSIAYTASGTIVGAQLLAGVAGYLDNDGDLPGTHLWQWYRATDAAGANRVRIDNATAALYQIEEADRGFYIVLGGKPVSATGTPNVGIEYFAVANAPVPGTPTGSAPTMDPPTITGHVGVGRTLTATTSGFNDVDGDGQGTHVYQWYRASDAAGTGLTPIDGANGLTHVITDADVNSWLHFGVTPVSDKAPTHGTEVRAAANRAVPVPTAPIYTSVEINYWSGGVSVGNHLSANIAGHFHDDDGDTVVDERVQWYRATDAAGEIRTPIDGATDFDYTIKSADIGYYIVMGITPVSSGTPSTGIEYFAVANAPVPGTVTYTNDTDTDIPDWNSTGVYVPIAVSGRNGNTPATAAVYVKVVHTFQDHVALRLIAPSGASYLLKQSAQGTMGANIEATYSVNLSAEPLNGTWQLRATDGGNTHIGYVDRWSITF